MSACKTCGGAKCVCALVVENERLRQALASIAYAGTSKPPHGDMPDEVWYRSLAHTFIRTATDALAGEPAALDREPLK